MSKIKMSPEWWRDYRKKRAAELRLYEKSRRQTPKRKQQRHASEALRRVRRRSEKNREEQFLVAASHPLLDWAKTLVNKGRKPRTSTKTLLFKEEALAEDLVSVAVLAKLDNKNPEEEIRRYKGAEQQWWWHTCQILAESEDV